MANVVPTPPIAAEAEDRIAVATQWQLMWWRFRKHKLAMFGSFIIILLYLVVIFADFLAYSVPTTSDSALGLTPPQSIHWVDNGQFSPHVYALVGKRDPVTFKRVYTADPNTKIPIRFFAKGFPYKLFGLFPTEMHLFGLEGADPQKSLFLLGTDNQGRDLWSRLMYGTQISLTIGLVSVAITLLLGVLFGGISGLMGGIVDTFIQRVIEVLASIPTIPLWMGLAAAVPPNWDILKVYFAVTIIISLLGWTNVARVVRGRFLSLREEDYVMAAEFVGTSRLRIIFRHMVPGFLSHLIAATTLALPNMIISETSLSFLGLGLRPPAISWGVLLQQAQNLQTIAISPWLLFPAIPVMITILAFNFMGDGLRDAADPYG
jgi:peptide/nickel transport system permease protein